MLSNVHILNDDQSASNQCVFIHPSFHPKQFLNLLKVTSTYNKFDVIDVNNTFV